MVYSVKKGGNVRLPFGSNPILQSLIIVFLLLPLTGLIADTIILKNGRELNGTIISQNRQEVRIRIGRRVRTISKRRIRRIRYLSAEEEQRQAEEKKRKEEERRRAAARRKQEAERRRAELRRKEEEQRKQAEQQRRAEEERSQAEQKRKAEEERSRAEQKRREEEERRRTELERRKSEEAGRAAAERKRQEEELNRQEEQKRLAEEREREAAHARLLESLASYHIDLRAAAGGGKYESFISQQLPKFATGKTVVQNMMDSKGERALSTHSPFQDDKQSTLQLGVALSWNRFFGDIDYYHSKLKPTYGIFEFQDRTAAGGELNIILGGGGSDSFMREETRFKAGYLFYRHRLFDLGGLGGYLRLKGGGEFGELSFRRTYSSGSVYDDLDIAYDRSENFQAKGALAGLSILYRPPFKFTIELSIYGFHLKGDWFHRADYLRFQPDPASGDRPDNISYGSLLDIRGTEIVLGFRYPLRNSWNLRIDLTGHRADVVPGRFLYYMNNFEDPLVPVYLRFMDSVFSSSGKTRESFSSITVGVEKRIRFR